MHTHTFADAAATVVSALKGAGLPVHPPPSPTTSLAAPALVVGLPTLVESLPMPGTVCGAVFDTRIDVLVLPSTASAEDLLDLTDNAVAALNAAALGVTGVFAAEYAPTNGAPPVPAMTITVE